MRVLLCLVLLPIGCTHMGSRQTQKDIYSIQARILHLEQSAKLNRNVSVGKSGADVANANASIQSIGQQMNRLTGEVDTIKAKLSGAYNNVESNDEPSTPLSSDQLSNLERRIAVLEKSQKLILSQLTILGKSQLSAAPKPRVSAPSVSRSKPNKPAAQVKANDYDALKSAYSKENYQGVIDSAQGVLVSTNGARKTMAVYYLADSHYALKSFRKAAINFSDYLEASTNEKRAATAKLKLADCFLQLGDKETARIYLDEIIEKHGKTKEAKLASNLIKSLR